MIRTNRFRQGFGTANFMPRPLRLGSVRLGQQTRLPADQALFDALQAGDQYLQMVNDWMAARPDWQTILGPDLAAFQAAQQTSQDLYQQAKGVESQLAAYNSPSDSDAQAAQQWANAVHTMFSITTNHPETSPGVPGLQTTTESQPSSTSTPASQTQALPPLATFGAPPGTTTTVPGSTPLPTSTAPVSTVANQPISATMILVGLGALGAIGMVWAVLASHD